ncbi:ABC transporter, periplasmic spermidine putrescine-binding protein PotD [Fimbriiglobus ruber]|uniref:ABC transporter, periplasmic spermidine putrescine-binding protein PotD n=1 Tax=Fimbriiglobus ruber TaxID=1908690 RepID=A0A225EBJ7_9BACT|nr:ABC transporter, periplasmic spermidine putrescine-binding protein PotD [Fimbriiglobus ruber]
MDKIFQEHFVEPFQALTGATVVLDAGWWDSIGKLKASPKGQPAYDLVLTDATQGYPAIKDGMFRQIDFNKVPNHRALAPVALDNWVAKERYGVTFHESAMTLGFDPKQVKAAPSGWGDLLRDDLKGKLALYNSFYFSLYTFGCMKVTSEGKPGTAWTAMSNDIGGVLDFAKRERGRVRFWWPTGTKMLQDLLQGNFAAGNAHSVTMLQAVKDKPDLGFVTPETDRAFVQLMWVIPADSPNAALAEAAIDFLMSKDVQAAMASRGAGTAHMAAAKEVAAEDPIWAKTYPSTDEQFRSLRYFPYEAYFKDYDGIAKIWEREVLRQS